MSEQQILSILLIDDDQDNLDQLLETLPKELEGYQLDWVSTNDFDKGIERIRSTHFDVVVTDIYLGDVEKRDAQALYVIERVKATRFCPVLAISSGPRPEKLIVGPFIGFAEKVRDEPIVEELARLLRTGIPSIVRHLHDDLDREANSYLWGFVQKEWDGLQQSGIQEGITLERLVRRRAAIQIGRLDKMTDGPPKELEKIEGLEFYIYPPISGNSFRLGDIIRKIDTDDFRVILTPHCHLTVQPGADSVRAEWVLTVKALPAKDVIAQASVKKGQPTDPWTGDKDDKLRRRTLSPPGYMGFDGRYWFLPGFLEIPDLYCDFLRLESVHFTEIKTAFGKVATLDYPFAEALQACFTNFYSAVGLPNLNLDHLKRLYE